MGLRLTGRRGRLIAGGAALALLAGAGAVTAVAADSDTPVTRADRTMSMPGAKIDTSFFTTGATTADDPKPAVLLGHGFGGSKDDTREQAEKLARSGYAVLTWSARGFGESTGRIGLNDPAREGKDVSALIDWLAERPEVRQDADGDPRVGVAGASYGGAAALLAAGHDKRVDAIAPVITYWDLADALFPGGVYKKLWAGIFFTTGSVMAQGNEDEGAEGAEENGGGQGSEEEPGGGAPEGGAQEPGDGPAVTPPPGQGQEGCGRFVEQLCRMYERVAESGQPDESARELLSERSPSAVGDRIKVPTLVVQGKTDSLFPLEHADTMAKTIKGNGAPVSVDWIAGGHDGGAMETDRVQQRITDWFDKHLAEQDSADTGPAFRVSRSGGLDSTSGGVTQRGATGPAYPGLSSGERTVRLTGEEQTFRNPPGGGPPSISAVPGVGSGLSQLGAVGSGISVDFPGQHARFTSAPLTGSMQVTGSPTVKLRVSAENDDDERPVRDAVLFGKLYDVGPDGRRVLPSQLVSPARVEDAAEGRDVTLRLPAIDREIKSGHRLELVLAATDLGYASPGRAADYTVSLDDTALRVPTAPRVDSEGMGLPWWVWGLPLIGLAVATALLLTGRRRTRPVAPDPELAQVPLHITGLSKRYAGAVDRYAVRDLDFRVERGQVLGLLGPNGAGKTTTLRMLMGLIKPDEGEIRLFGQAVRPGAPVLSRVGAFVEGAGFLPHLTGRANLELYWQATGRPAEDAHLEEALEIADLGEALDRAVRTYSQGMRQRLAIAQAMLGLPELLILDEPTNGLDPPQIREMREVMIRYAEGGRTVIVSSHLLAEVEQSCTHLVVMDRGRLVRSGPVAEITGEGDSLLVGVHGDHSAAQLDAWADKVAALPGVEGAVRTDDGLLVRLSGAGPQELLPELLRLDVPVERFGPHRRLEDAFLTMIGGQSA
ncbi:alpha/beta fold hydrolase [Streptomyces sp. P38-E01]|uniref:Alpha/beta fold hydrolase n=1 Tax=Streptomyces tardus TaxID=2780544 RepID=A0A949JS74_9ACTN|nr:alpha/beta fold hydrolase [Streptomyces tardus]MBU7599200.1 alpha/beta fold hydrolase [Streptomyces tardus]